MVALPQVDPGVFSSFQSHYGAMSEKFPFPPEIREAESYRRESLGGGYQSPSTLPIVSYWPKLSPMASPSGQGVEKEMKSLFVQQKFYCRGGMQRQVMGATEGSSCV